MNTICFVYMPFTPFCSLAYEISQNMATRHTHFTMYINFVNTVNTVNILDELADNFGPRRGMSHSKENQKPQSEITQFGTRRGKFLLMLESLTQNLFLKIRKVYIEKLTM